MSDDEPSGTERSDALPDDETDETEGEPPSDGIEEAGETDATDESTDRTREPRTLGPSGWKAAADPSVSGAARTPELCAEGGTDASHDAGPGSSFEDPQWYLNRELSELGFQWRVLFEALDERTPLLERLRFLSIVSRNLDEFFMKRIGGLKQQLAADVTEPTVDGLTPREQWRAALGTAEDLFEVQDECFTSTVRPLLSEAGIEIVDLDDLSAAESDRLESYFESSVLPTLTPLTFDPAHPFPFISNLSLSLAVLTRDDDGEKRFSRVKIPSNQPRLVSVTDPGASVMNADESGRVIPLERVIEANLELLFPNIEIVHTSTFRVTRNAEVRRNEDIAEGLVERIEDVLRQRRFATVVRLEVAEDVHENVLKLLTEHLDITEHELFRRAEPLAVRDFETLYELERPELKPEPWTPKQHPKFAGLIADSPGEVFEGLRASDALVHHPYHSFGETVQTFLDAAAHDPDCLAIKIAIYRTAPDSTVIRSLIDAAKNGKQVAVMVELKARFDEENNLRWVKRLEEEGIHVAYGSIELKTHSKVALAVRKEDDGVRTYSHVATGNYHSGTAKGYVDLGLFTSDPGIGHDIVSLFNSFTGHTRHEEYRKLLVAPETLRTRLVELIEREKHHARNDDEGRIVAKMNSLEDPEIVRELYEAGAAGVEIDLIVRGICRLRPGVPGVTDSVRVHSVVGRFLEHSRIFRFENDGDPAYFIGSADWMTRNLDRRVEAVAPVESPELRAELDAILSVMLNDDRKRWTMRPDGSYVQKHPADGKSARDTHTVLMQRARAKAPDDGRRSEPESRREPNIDLGEMYTDEGVLE